MQKFVDCYGNFICRHVPEMRSALTSEPERRKVFSILQELRPRVWRELLLRAKGNRCFRRCSHARPQCQCGLFEMTSLMSLSDVKKQREVHKHKTIDRHKVNGSHFARAKKNRQEQASKGNYFVSATATVGNDLKALDFQASFAASANRKTFCNFLKQARS